MSTDHGRSSDYHPSSPIPIDNSSRRRHMSFSSSSDSSQSSLPLHTPDSSNPPKVSTSPSTSPLLSYFMGVSSPTKGNTFPLTRPPPGFGAAQPVFEDEEMQDEAQSSLHHRRATSTGWTGNTRLAQPPTQAAPPASQNQQQQRGAGVLRRLSLGGGFRPNVAPPSPPLPSAPPPSAASPPAASPPDAGTASALPATPRKPRRSATVSNGRSPDARGRRAPSPMGERILKGHFDGFN